MNEQHPIEGLMTTAMDSIRDMIDVNTIIGEPIETSNNMVFFNSSSCDIGPKYKNEFLEVFKKYGNIK